MAKASHRVRVQVLLRAECRNEEGRTRAAKALQNAGLEVTGRGLASISVRGTSEVVRNVFGAMSARATRGTRADAADGEFSVPDTLAEYVERISIAPQHVTMAGEDTDSEKEKR